MRLRRLRNADLGRFRRRVITREDFLLYFLYLLNFLYFLNVSASLLRMACSRCVQKTAGAGARTAAPAARPR
jgi:hypothetical protein